MKLQRLDDCENMLKKKCFYSIDKLVKKLEAEKSGYVAGLAYLNPCSD
jgi:hypothetical protein